MPTFEDEFRRYFPIARILSRVSLLVKKVIVRGAENFVREGPSIIVGNHCGSFKDVAARPTSAAPDHSSVDACTSITWITLPADEVVRCCCKD